MKTWFVDGIVKWQTCAWQIKFGSVPVIAIEEARFTVYELGPFVLLVSSADGKLRNLAEPGVFLWMADYLLHDLTEVNISLSMNASARRERLHFDVELICEHISSVSFQPVSTATWLLAES